MALRATKIESWRFSDPERVRFGSERVVLSGVQIEELVRRLAIWESGVPRESDRRIIDMQLARAQNKIVGISRSTSWLPSDFLDELELAE